MMSQIDVKNGANDLPAPCVEISDSDAGDQVARQHFPLKSINLRRVPYWVWKQARQNALESNMAFAEYVTRLLSGSCPYPADPP